MAAGPRPSLRRRIARIGPCTLLAGVVLAPDAATACSAPVERDYTTVVTCSAAIAEQTFVVPPGVRTLRVIAVGASGANGSPRTGAGTDTGLPRGGGPGGRGVVVSAQLRVTPGRKLYILAGGTGGSSGGPQPGPGGFNGGARGGTAVLQNGFANFASGAGGGGGGASDVRTCSVLDRSCNSLASRLVVAGGGGGGGGDSGPSFGGPGGWGSVGDGDSGDGSPADGGGGVEPLGTGGGGGGATPAAGGRAGGPYAAAGTRGAGGRGADSDASGNPGGGGGGGGGVFGGGGGTAGVDLFTAGSGGGAGASSGPAGARFAHASPGPGSVTIAYLPATVDQPPAVTVTRPRAGQVLRRLTGRGTQRVQRRIVIAGRATDPSGVQAVALTIQRLPARTPAGSPRQCSWVVATGGLERRACARPPTLFAVLRARGAWTYELPRSPTLPAARYRATAYGTDGTGLFGNLAPRARRVVTFSLSQR